MTPENDQKHLPSQKQSSSIKGSLFVISAPSGAGKSTLCTAVCRNFPDMLYSISSTTRAPRPGETNGVDYFFINKEEFKAGINANRWAEWAKVHDNFYGTSAKYIDENLEVGKNILLDIDVQGAAQIVKRYPLATTIFIMPPSTEELRRRLESRGTDSSKTIAKRMTNAILEMERRTEFQHIIINDNLKKATDELLHLVSSKFVFNLAPDQGKQS